MGAEIKRHIKVAVLLFDGVEILDFAGPGEVFSITEGFEVFTVSLDTEPVNCQNFLTLIPTYSLDDCPAMDILVIPGGKLEPLLEHQKLQCWIRASSLKAMHLLSISKGAGFLAKAGLLHKREVATLKSYQRELQQLDPTATILPFESFADNGQVITAAGVSAGIDCALHLVCYLRGKEAALKAAENMEYTGWKASSSFFQRFS